MRAVCLRVAPYYACQGGSLIELVYLLPGLRLLLASEGKISRAQYQGLD